MDFPFSPCRIDVRGDPAVELVAAAAEAALPPGLQDLPLLTLRTGLPRTGTLRINHLPLQGGEDVYINKNSSSFMPRLLP